MKLDRVIAVRKDKTIYRDEDRCIKVFNEEYSKSGVLNEALNHSRIEETKLSIPKVLEVTNIDGKWAIVFEFIKGKTLAQLMEEEPDKKDEYLEMFVDLQLSVHKKTCPLLNKLKDRMSSKISDSELDATTRYDLQARLREMPKHNKVCHGDFDPSNIIITKDGTPYIFDWSHATQGNASADVACTYLLFRLNGDDKGAKKYLDLFCEKSDTQKQYVLKWIPLVAASLSVNRNEKEREFLLSLVNAPDYE